MTQSQHIPSDREGYAYLSAAPRAPVVDAYAQHVEHALRDRRAGEQDAGDEYVLGKFRRETWTRASWVGLTKTMVEPYVATGHLERRYVSETRSTEYRLAAPQHQAQEGTSHAAD